MSLVTSRRSDDLPKAFLMSLEARSPRDATRFALSLMESGMTPQEVIREVLAPAQRLVGERWERAEWTVADEHRATAVTDAALHHLVPST